MSERNERKINHVWCNPEGMETPHLLDLQASCLKQLERTHQDLETITKIIGERAVNEEAPVQNLR